VLPTKNIALVPLAEWVNSGATVEIVEFEEHEREKIVALARRAILRDLTEMTAFVEGAIDEVRSRCSFVERHPTGSAERDAALERAEKYAYTALWRAKRTADAAEEASLHFALTADIASAVDALRLGIKARSAAFFALTDDARKSVTQLDAFAKGN
jgi:predicted nucleotidyltransferase component of viral defense system